MSVYFVYRCHYGQPSEKFVRRFDHASVLDWFRDSWRELSGALTTAQTTVGNSYELCQQTLGCRVYGFDTLFEAAAEHSLPPPETAEVLEEYLRQHLYVEGEMLFDAHAVQVLTDDDELQMAYFFVDDVWRAEHPGQSDFLLHADWKLPAGVAAGEYIPREETRSLGRASGDGTLYMVFLGYSDSGNLYDLGGVYRVDGLRLDGLARFLAAAAPSEEWPLALRVLRSQLLDPSAARTAEERAFLEEIAANPKDGGRWDVYSDWLQERGRPTAEREQLERALRGSCAFPVATIANRILWTEFGRGSIDEARGELQEMAGQVPHRQDPSKSDLLMVDGLAQLCLHMEQWEREGDLYHQWTFFEDRWAAAHRDLADGLMRFATRWDVLSVDGEE